MIYHPLLWMIYFPSSLLPGPNYYSNNSHRQPPLPLAHWHADKIAHGCWGQSESCFSGLQGCHRDCALQSHSQQPWAASACFVLLLQHCLSGGCQGRSSSATTCYANLPLALLCFLKLWQPPPASVRCSLFAKTLPEIYPGFLCHSSCPPLLEQGRIDWDGRAEQVSRGRAEGAPTGRCDCRGRVNLFVACSPLLGLAGIFSASPSVHLHLGQRRQRWHSATSQHLGKGVQEECPSISKGPFQLALAQPHKISPPGPGWQHQ